MRNYLIILIVLSIAGCQNKLKPSLRSDLIQSSAIIKELSHRCADGDPNACIQGLDLASQTIDNIIDATN